MRSSAGWLVAGGSARSCLRPQLDLMGSGRWGWKGDLDPLMTAVADQLNRWILIHVWCTATFGVQCRNGRGGRGSGSIQRSGGPTVRSISTRLFGVSQPLRGYDDSPAAPGADERVDLYNLYHLLNHANLFGSGYVSRGQSQATGLTVELKDQPRYS